MGFTKHESNRDHWLLCGGLLSGVASLLHVAIIFGGPEWYRFFGAGERMARLAARGSPYPMVVTAFIASILGIWAFYALSGVGIVGRLPFLRSGLVLIAAIYVCRGILGIPLILLMDHPYALELRGRMTFMVVSSVTCIVLAICYAVGAAEVLRRSRDPLT
jgi:putative oxidoreductase